MDKLIICLVVKLAPSKTYIYIYGYLLQNNLTFLFRFHYNLLKYSKLGDNLPLNYSVSENNKKNE